MRSKMPWIRRRDTRGGARWDVRIYVGGKPPYLYKTFESEKDAKKWAREQEMRKDAGQRPTTDRRTLSEYLSEWLSLKERGAVVDRNGQRRAPGPRTMDDYRRLATEWIIQPDPDKLKECDGIGRTRLDRVTYQTLNSLYTAMTGATTVRTVKKLNRLLGQAFVELEQKGILPRNPADWANVPQVEISERGDTADEESGDDSSANAMTEEQAESFLASARALADEQERQRDHIPFIPERCWSALWHVLLCGGLRPGEAFALQWADVSEIGCSVHVRQNLIRIRGRKGYELRKPKTKKSRRVVPLPTPAWRELMLWRKQQKRQRLMAGVSWSDAGFVFTTSKGTPLHGARRSFARVCAKVGLGTWGEEPKRIHLTGPLPAREFTPAFRIYDLRHTYVSLLLMKGVPVNVVSDLVGHEKASFTIARYGHALPRQTREAVQALESVLFGKVG